MLFYHSVSERKFLIKSLHLLLAEQAVLEMHGNRHHSKM